MSRQASPSGYQGAPRTKSTTTTPAAAAQQYDTVFTNHKAGMDNVDQAKVKQVVYEMSKDSAHFQNEQRKIQQTEEKIARMKAMAASLTSTELAAKAAAMDARIAELEATRDLTRTWIHVDMDAFFASVEELANPCLKGKPFAVGGIGMISTANYAARAFGVRSAMPGFIALRLCPQLTIVPPNFDKYRSASEMTRKVFEEYDPNFESTSLDEAALDVTDICALQEVSGAEIAEQIREKVRSATGELTCSCGVAPNRTLAKICSDKNKPNGQYILESTKSAVEAFVQELPVRKVPGVGRVTENVLRAFGVEKCGEIYQNRGLLAALFSPISMEFFLHCALGLGSTHHGETVAEGEVGRKGISTERTFRPMSKRNELESKCKELAENLAKDMADENLKGKTLTMKLKLTTFEVRTRAVTLTRYIHSAEDIYAAGLKLLRAELPVEIRLMGLRMSHFYEEPKRAPDQPSLQDVFSKRESKQKKQQQQEQDDDDYKNENEAVHSSQVLSAGDEVELTLREWKDPSTDVHPALPANESKQATKAVEQTSLWECTACTFLNPKRHLLCEMCGCSKTGTRPGDTDHHCRRGGGGSKKRSQTTAGAEKVPGSILDFLSSGGPQSKTQKK